MGNISRYDMVLALLRASGGRQTFIPATDVTISNFPPLEPVIIERFPNNGIHVSSWCSVRGEYRHPRRKSYAIQNCRAHLIN